MAKKNFKKRPNIFKGESNPFNVKVNREKRHILGQKVKGTKGLPIISHATNHAKRKEIWQRSKVKSQKANRFVDKRQMDGALSIEERKTSRMIKEQKRKIKKNMFNLNDDEELTHLGLSLQEVKNFESKESASEDEEPLGPDFVKQAHFGGFNVDEKEKPKTHKEIMEELIVKSKQTKEEKKVERELTTDLTEKLDQDWKNVLSIMSGIKATKQVESSEKNDPYNVIAKELRYETKAAPTTRIKTAEELEQEEQVRFLELEKAKQVRMVDEEEFAAKKVRNHLSADDICDDFDLQPISAEETAPVVSAPSQNESEYSDSDESTDSLTSAQISGKGAENIDIEIPKNEYSFNYDRNIPYIPTTLKEFEEHLSSLDLNSNDPEAISNAIRNLLMDKLKYKSGKMLSRLDMFFSILIEYALKCLDTNISITGVLPPYLYTLINVSPLNTSKKLLSFLDHEYSEFKCLKKNNKFPSLKALLILKYCSVLYSVSDFSHPVITPAILFMCDVLSCAYFMTLPNIISRLFVCNVILHCVSESKRLVPEPLCFLRKVLNLAVPEKSKNSRLPIKNKQISLVLDESTTVAEIAELDVFNLKNSVCNDNKRLSIISLVIYQLHQFANLYVGLPSYFELFSPVFQICSQLPTDKYPVCLQNSISSLNEAINKTFAPVHHLVYENTKPKPLKMFEPAFESKYNNKTDDINKKFKLLKSVSQKIRKEEKSLLRETRRDAQMIGAEKLRETLESDAERKRKVKELYHELSVQEGEYKKIMKKK